MENEIKGQLEFYTPALILNMNIDIFLPYPIFSLLWFMLQAKTYCKSFQLNFAVYAHEKIFMILCFKFFVLDLKTFHIWGEILLEKGSTLMGLFKGLKFIV